MVVVLEVVPILIASCFGQLKGITITTVNLTSGILEGSLLAHTVGQLGALLITKSIRSLIVDLTQGDGGFGVLFYTTAEYLRNNGYVFKIGIDSRGFRGALFLEKV